MEAVIVCLPNHLHFPACLAALESGRHVLCEKPPTLRVGEMEVLRDEARRRGLTYAFGRQFRFSAPVLAARRLVEAGRLGRIYYGKSRWLRLRGIPAGVGGWFTDKARSGGGAMVDLGVHSLDAAWYLAGCPRLASVTAHTGACFIENGDVEDTAFAFLRFEGGLVVFLEVAWAMNLGDADAEPSEWWGREGVRTTLYGTHAAVQITPPAVFRGAPGSAGPERAPLAIPAGDEFESLPGQLPAFARQLADFVRAVTTGTRPVNNAADAVELMKMLSGIYESSARGEEVRFE